MRVSEYRSVLGAASVAWVITFTGCGSEEIKLKEAPPVAIGEKKDMQPTTSAAALKQGAPRKGSSAGLTHRPDETP